MQSAYGTLDGACLRKKTNERSCYFMLFCFLRAVAFLRRFLCFCVSSSSSCLSALLWLSLWVCFSPLFLFAWLLRVSLFACFRRPSRRPVGAPRCGSWRCVSASALPGVFRAGWWVWSVRPAVVRRGSGVVLWFWVFVSVPAVGGDEE